jgi:thiamine biosynthesis protein ThiI
MNKYDAFLIKYAEIGIKGKNRHIFEEALVRQIRIALRPCEGHFNVIRTYGRVFVEAKTDYDFQ